MLYKFAKRYIGKDVSPTQGELGCVESVFTILKEYGINFKESLSTIRFDKELSQHPLFEEIDKPELGCIIISITQNRKKVGHIGWVIEDNKIISNDSKTSKLSINYSVFTWTWKYKRLMGLQTKYYRYLEDKHIEQLEKQFKTLSEVVVNLAQKVILALTSKINMNLGASTSPKYSLNKIDGAKIWRTFLITIGGSALTFALSTVKEIDFGIYTATVLSISVVAVEALRRLLTNYSMSPYNPEQ